MTILEYLLSDSLVQVIGQTMLHSLWQGVLVAGILVLCWPFLRESTAANRYAIFSVALLTLFGIVVSTFAYLYGAAMAGTAGNGILLEPNLSYLVEEQTGLSNGQPASSGVFLPWLVMIWIVGISIMSVRLILEWVYLERLRIHSVPLDDQWQLELDKLADQLGLQEGIRLVQSKWVSSPVTIGMFRPLVLMPIGLVNGLNTEQVACILAHELAHIRRHDFLVNILQSVVETLLFFNPMVWWLSRHIREERELCCDDIAVGLTGDKRQLAYTLAKLEEWRMEVPSLALGFNSAPNKAIARIRRLIGQEGPTKVITKGWTSIALLTTMITLVAFRPVDSSGMEELRSTISATIADPVEVPQERQLELELLAKMAKEAAEEAELAKVQADLNRTLTEYYQQGFGQAVGQIDTVPPAVQKELELQERALHAELQALERAFENSPERKEMEALAKEYEVLHQKMEAEWKEKHAGLEKKLRQVEKIHMEELREKEKLLHASPEMKQLEELHRAFEKQALALQEELEQKGDLKQNEKLQREMELKMMDLHQVYQAKEEQLRGKVQAQMEEIQEIHRRFQTSEAMQEMQQMQEKQQQEFQKLNNEIGEKTHQRMQELQSKLQSEYHVQLEELVKKLEEVRHKLERSRKYREE